MVIYTIGFAGKPAARFFQLLAEHGVRCVVDTRLHPKGQLSGFAKQDDLTYFLSALLHCTYRHVPELAPDADLLARYRRDHDWARYARAFEALLDERDILTVLEKRFFEDTACCLLCSEHKPDKCHRRLVAERLSQQWEGTTVIHLM